MTGPLQQVDRLAREFRRRHGGEPEGVWMAPGRVNILGEHTDYNEGFVLPVAIDRCAVVAVARRHDHWVRGWSVQLGASGDISLDDLAAERASGWLGYVAGVTWVLREKGLVSGGVDVVVDSDVPVGAGLSSSAALECSLALALGELSGMAVDRMALALAAQRAEREVVGAPVGVMDQAVSLLGRAGHALFLDCRSLETVQLPLGLEDAGLALVVIDTHVSHTHSTGAYADRRRECAAAAARAGVPALRDLVEEGLGGLDGTLLRRARHIVTDNQRVLEAIELLPGGRVRGLGPLLAKSHLSLRDDFEVSTAELDVAVGAAVAGGALGARMTGGGFGGSALALVPCTAVPAVARAVEDAFGRQGFAPATVFTVQPADGASRLQAS